MKTITFDIKDISRSGFKTPSIRPVRSDKVDDKIGSYASSVERTINKLFKTAGHKKEVLVIKKENKVPKKLTAKPILFKRQSQMKHIKQGPYSEIENIDDQIYLIKNLLDDDNKIEFIEKRKKQEQLHKEMDERYKKAKNNINLQKDLIKEALTLSHNHYKMKIIANNLLFNSHKPQKRKKTIIAPEPLSKTPSKPNTARMNKTGFSFFSQSCRNIKTPESVVHKKFYSTVDFSAFKHSKKSSIDSHKMAETYRTISAKCISTISESKTLRSSMNSAIPHLTQIKMHRLKMDLKSEILYPELLKDMRAETREYKKEKKFFVYNKRKNTPVCISDKPNNVISRIHFVDSISEEAAYNSRRLIDDRYGVKLSDEDLMGFRNDYHDFTNFKGSSRNRLLTPEEKIRNNGFKLRESLFKTQQILSKSNNKLTQFHL
jgi:hypothetical protein